MRILALFGVLLVAVACGSAAGSDQDAGGVPNSGSCVEPEDCPEGDTCIGNSCVPANCEDFKISGNETDVDCGGDCGPCNEGQQCVVAYDCVSQFCNGDNSCQDCQSLADCAGAPGTFCAGGICVQSKALGATCTVSDQCGSGNCVDGVCCDGPCDGECEACDSTGTCKVIPAGTDPDEECPDPDAGSSCGVTGMCNGAGACGAVADDTACTIAGCAAGPSAEGQCAGGFCETGTEPSCGNYACVNDACLSSCSAANATGDLDCADGYYCLDADSCVKKKNNGVSCQEGRECVYGNCVDGVCCNSSCNGTCKSCVSPDNGLANSNGTCGNIPAGQGSECTDDGSSSCGQNGKCDGAGGCQVYSDATVCAPQKCENSRQYPETTCSGGSCLPGKGTPCKPYYCLNTTTCDTNCPSNNSAGDAECQSSYYCDGNTCEPQLPDGELCSRDRQCANGACIDSTCCALLNGETCPSSTHWCPLDGTCVLRCNEFAKGSAGYALPQCPY